ncbi:MAG: 4Fe-4S binding protein [Armatimonadetes bacterium]|jgi:MinD superfamily P-loop ATPase|nr:4Fe-4S binding protein [Armatimonadota bacterium]
MKEIVMLSGKGGTGKTSITASFAALADRSVLVDCDVDAADLHLVLEPKATESHEFLGGRIAVIDPDKCTACGECAKACRFDAIHPEADYYSVDEIECEGCGVCALVCPTDAITLQDTISGQWYLSQTRFGPMVHARLGAGGENSGKLVTLIRKKARDIAEASDAQIIITDGPPGIGCPVIASLADANRVIIVTEPTVSGIHDLERVAKLAVHFKVPASIIVNKYDINTDKAEQIDQFAEANKLDVLGRIPYDPVVTAAQLVGKSVVEYCSDGISKTLRDIWGRVSRIID